MAFEGAPALFVLVVEAELLEGRNVPRGEEGDAVERERHRVDPHRGLA